MGPVRFLKSSRVKAVLIGVGLVLFVGGGTGAALCKLELDCHIRSAGPIEDISQKTAGTGGGPMHLPAGFHVSAVVRNLSYPTDFDFLPDGRIVIAEKDGLVLLSKHGRLSRRPFLDLRNRVDTQALRGLVDVTVDPAYPDRPYVYVVYAAKGSEKGHDRPTSVRVSRFR